MTRSPRARGRRYKDLMVDGRGRGGNKNSLLLPPEVMKDVPARTTTNKLVSNGKITKKRSQKTWYGWLQGWIRGRRVVLRCIDVIETGKLRVNLHITVYDRGT